MFWDAFWGGVVGAVAGMSAWLLTYVAIMAFARKRRGRD